MYNALSSVIGGGRGAQQEHLALRDVVPHVAACGPHQRSSQILFVSQKRLFQQYLPTADSYLLQSPTRASAPPSEAQPAMHLVEHHAKIEIPLWRKSPIHRGRNRIVCPGALRMRAVGAEGAPSSGGAEKGILDVVVIGADHIHVIRDGVFRAGPHDL